MKKIRSEITIEIKCDFFGCQATDHVISDDAVDATLELLDRGWKISNVSVDFCPDHAPKPKQ